MIDYNNEEINANDLIENSSTSPNNKNEQDDENKITNENQKLLPVRCWFCNRFISHLYKKIFKTLNIIKSYPYCCKKFFLVHKL